MSRGRWPSAIVLAGYIAVSCAFFGWRLLPHPGRLILGQGGDPDIYIWSLAWWPHAIGSFINPFVSHAVYAPTGVNIAWTPSAPGFGLILAPVTVLFGPVVAFNLAALLLPALGAWTAYRLCRYLTGSLWAALVGGYLFGFSTAMLRQVLPGNLNLAGVFLFPLVAHLLVRYVRRELSGRALAWRLGLALALQLTISTEFAAMLTIALIACLLLAFALVPDVRARIRSSVLPVLAAYGVGVVVVAPFVYYLVFHFEEATTVTDIDLWGTDLLGFVVPAFVNGLGGTDLVPTALLARVPSHSAYLGLPTVIMIALYAVRNRRRPGARFLVAAFAAAVVVTLGASLKVYGHTLFSLPWWRLATHVPGLNDALPFRLAVFASLAAGVITAAWIATTKGWIARRPVALPVLAVLAIAPAVWQSSNPYFSPTRPARVAFFTTGIYKTCIPRNETVAVLPFGSRQFLWQAETGFWFRLAATGLQPDPKDAPLNAFDADPIVAELVAGRHPPAGALLGFAGAHAVGRLLGVPGGGYPTPAQLRAAGPTALAGGLLVSPACGRAPLTSRDLKAYIARWEVPAKPSPGSSRPHVAWCLGGRFFTLVEGLKPSGANSGATQASFVDGTGLTCSPPPPGYTQHGLAGSDQGVPAGIYPYFAPS